MEPQSPAARVPLLVSPRLIGVYGWQGSPATAARIPERGPTAVLFAGAPVKSRHEPSAAGTASTSPSSTGTAIRIVPSVVPSSAYPVPSCSPTAGIVAIPPAADETVA